MKKIYAKIRIIIPVISFILFIGSVVLPFAGLNHPLVNPLFTLSYIMFILCALFAHKFRMVLLFLLFASLVPVVELLHLSHFSLEVRQIFFQNIGVFTFMGEFGTSLFALIIPILVVNYKIYKRFFKT